MVKPVSHLASQLKRKIGLSKSHVIQFLADKDPDVRAEAAQIAGELKLKNADKKLKELLQDAQLEVRLQSAVALVRLGDEGLFWELIQALISPERRVVIGAALTLGRLRDKRAVDALIFAFKTNDMEVGAAVAWALGQCQAIKALPWLFAAASNGFAVANVCDALGEIGDVRALHILMEALKSSLIDVRAYAARAVSYLELDSKVAKQVIEFLLPLLSDPVRKVRLCAAFSLHRLNKIVKLPNEESGR